MNSMISLVFFGTDEFAMIVLEALKGAGFDIHAEITKPMPSKELVKLIQLGKLDADLGVVAVYGKILPKGVLEHFRYGFLNIHPSLLPKYRGPSPIRTAIANGDTETGVTIIKLDDEMDHGDVVAKMKYEISKVKNHEEIRNELAELGASLLIKIIPDYVAGKIIPQPQDHSQATYTRLLTRDDGQVDLQKNPPEKIYNKFRAYEGWPGIWTTHKGQRVKILNCRLIDDKLEIKVVQPESKKSMALKDFENGYGKLAIRHYES